MSKYLWQVVIYTMAKLCPDFVNLNLIKIFVYKHKISVGSYTIQQVLKENNQKAYLLAVETSFNLYYCIRSVTHAFNSHVMFV